MFWGSLCWLPKWSASALLHCEKRELANHGLGLGEFTSSKVLHDLKSKPIMGSGLARQRAIGLARCKTLAISQKQTPHSPGGRGGTFRRRSSALSSRRFTCGRHGSPRPRVVCRIGGSATGRPAPTAEIWRPASTPTRALRVGELERPRVARALAAAAGRLAAVVARRGAPRGRAGPRIARRASGASSARCRPSRVLGVAQPGGNSAARAHSSRPRRRAFLWARSRRRTGASSSPSRRRFLSFLDFFSLLVFFVFVLFQCFSCACGPRRGARSCLRMALCTSGLRRDAAAGASAHRSASLAVFLASNTVVQQRAHPRPGACAA